MQPVEDGTTHGDEFFQQENRILATRIGHILAQAKGPAIEADGAVAVTSFNREPLETVYVMMGSEDCLQKPQYEAAKRFILASQFLTFPIYYVEHARRGKKESTTPYGRKPHLVIASDGKLYEFTSSSYHFDTQGHAFKWETIVCWTDMHKAGKIPITNNFFRIRGMIRDEVEEIDFIPDQNDSRKTDLDVGDYEKLGVILHYIETGVFEEDDYTKPI